VAHRGPSWPIFASLTLVPGWQRQDPLGQRDKADGRERTKFHIDAAFTWGANIKFRAPSRCRPGAVTTYTPYSVINLKRLHGAGQKSTKAPAYQAELMAGFAR